MSTESRSPVIRLDAADNVVVARRIAAYFDEERLADFPYVDGVAPFVHEQGRGLGMRGKLRQRSTTRRQ
jgi:altronate dehydratase